MEIHKNEIRKRFSAFLIVLSLVISVLTPFAGVVSAQEVDGAGETASLNETSDPILTDNYPFKEYYPSVDELYAWYTELENEYPELVEMHEYGQSYEGRDLWALEITSDEDTVVEEKPSVLIDGALHAREWSSVQVATYYLWRLVSEYDTNETVNWLVNNRRIFVIPMTNPDGYIFDGNGDLSQSSMWRKNRNHSTPTDAVGTDLNRNWDIVWEEGNSDPGSDTYRGEDPFSEPETHHLKDLIIDEEIDSYQNLHSHHHSLLIPYMHTNDPSPHDDWYRGTADHMTSLTSLFDEEDQEHYDYGQPHEMIGYSAPGGAADWVYDETGAHGLTFEIYTGGGVGGRGEGGPIEEEVVGSRYSEKDVQPQGGFYPPEEDIMNINHDLDDSLIYQTRIADADLGDGDEHLYPPVPYLIYGQIEEEEGPLPGVEVEFENQETGETLFIETDNNGYYEFNLAGLVDEGYEEGDEFTLNLDADGVMKSENDETSFVIDETWGKRIDLDYSEHEDISPVDVPTWSEDSSWTYDQKMWYNDTETDDYLYIDEEITYTVDEIGYYEHEGNEYLGYNLTLEGDVIEGEGEIYIDEIGDTVELEIDDGYVSGYQFVKMSDLAVIVDDQFRNIQGTAEWSIFDPDFESWTKVNNIYYPPSEEYDFPMNATDDKFWSNSTVESTGYNAFDIAGWVQENETIDETFDLNATSYTPFSESIEVPAGEFESIYLNSTSQEEIELPTINEEELSYRERWYSPEVKSYAKETYDTPEADMIRELEEYEVHEDPNDLNLNPSEAWIGESVEISGDFPNHEDQELMIKIPEGAEPESEWKTTTDEEGKFEKSVEVPVAEDMTETEIDNEFSSVGFVATVENETDDDNSEITHTVSSLVILHDNEPVYPDPPDGATGIDSETELSVIAAHDRGEELDFHFHDASDDSIIDSDENVQSGEYANVDWEGLDPNSSYGWYVNATEVDSGEYWISDTWSFETEEVEEYDLTFIVEDEEAESIEGATVTLNDMEDTTDSDGEALFEDLEPDTYDYTVEKEGYETVDDEVTIEDEDVTEEVNLEVSTYDVTFVVQDEDEEPYEGVVIELTDHEDLETDAQGEALLEDVEHGSDVHYTIDEEGYEKVDETVDDVTENLTEEVTLELSVYELTVENPVGEGVIYVYGEEVDTPFTDLYEEEIIVELYAEAAEGYEFSHWDVNGETLEEAEITVEMDADKRAQATFEEVVEDYELMLKEPVGEGDIYVDGKLVEEFPYEEESEVGTVIELEAEEAESFVFDEWTIDEEVHEDETIEILMDADKTAQATFLEQFELTIEEPVGEGDLYLDGDLIDDYPYSEVFLNGTEIGLEAVASDNYEFVEWKINSETYDDDKTTLEMIESKTIDATFEKETQKLTFQVIREDGVPIEGAIVEVDGMEGMTDSNGETTFENFSSDTYDWEVSHEDYETEDGQVEIADEDKTIEVMMEEIVMTYTLTFEVENDDGDPIEDASVELNGLENTTNEEGKAVFEDLDLDTYEYEINHDDYETKEGEVEIDKEAVTITVGLEEDEIGVGMILGIVIIAAIILIVVAFYMKRNKESSDS